MAVDAVGAGAFMVDLECRNRKVEGSSARPGRDGEKDELRVVD